MVFSSQPGIRCYDEPGVDDAGDPAEDGQDDVDEDSAAEVKGEVVTDPRRYIPSVMISTGRKCFVRGYDNLRSTVPVAHQEKRVVLSIRHTS